MAPECMRMLSEKQGRIFQTMRGNASDTKRTIAEANTALRQNALNDIASAFHIALCSSNAMKEGMNSKIEILPVASGAIMPSGISRHGKEKTMVIVVSDSRLRYLPKIMSYSLIGNDSRSSSCFDCRSEAHAPEPANAARAGNTGDTANAHIVDNEVFVSPRKQSR